MIKSLRKRHLQIWRLWALLLPLLMVAAVVVRKPVGNENLVMANRTGKLPVLVAEKQLGKNLVQVRSDTNDTRQLVWANKEELAVPSATIYLVPDESAGIKEGQYVGRIETRGDYVFRLPTKKDYHLVIYDFIHQQIIDRFSLSGSLAKTDQQP